VGYDAYRPRSYEWKAKCVHILEEHVYKSLLVVVQCEMGSKEFQETQEVPWIEGKGNIPVPELYKFCDLRKSTQR
jgi:hypothetical protein